MSFVALLAMAAAATGPARAQSNSEELFYTLDGTQTGGNSAYYESSAITQGGISWSVTGNTTMNPWRIGGSNLNGVDRDIYSQGSLNETITKVTLDFGSNNGITVNSITMIVASDENFADIIEQKTVSYSAFSTVDVTPGAGIEWTNAYYMFTFNVTGNHYFRLNAIRFYYDANAQQGGGSEPEQQSQMYTVTFAEGTEDVGNWSITPAAAATTGVAEGTEVTISYTGSRKVKSVTLVEPVAPAPAGLTLDLATVTADTTVEDGYTVTGTLGANVKISIADGATVTLDGVTINGVRNNSYAWAGITCLGDATIILSGTNTVKGFDDDYPGIFVPENKTLTIQGDGSLTASSNGYGAGIGGGYQIACGNIVIEGGTVNAQGGTYAAGIGGGYENSCGNISITGGTVNAQGGNSAAGIGGGEKNSCGNISITGGTITATGGNYGAGIGSGDRGSCGTVSITGGTITATGGNYAAGIGSGYRGSCDNISITGGTITATGGNYGAGIGSGDKGSCGTVTITGGVTSVTATKGFDAPNSIGAGYNGTCGTVTIGGTVGAITTSPYTYTPGN